MVKIDEIKEEIGWLKIIFGILTAVDISLLGWMAKNYNSSNEVLLFVALTVLIVSTFGIVVVNKKAFIKIRQLKDL